MARTDTTEGQALWQPGGAEEDSRFREGDRHLRLAYDEEEVQHIVYATSSPGLCGNGIQLKHGVDRDLLPGQATPAIERQEEQMLKRSTFAILTGPRCGHFPFIFIFTKV